MPRTITPKDVDSRTTPAPPPAAPNASNGYRPLNVKDALSYLDQVKVMFSENPEVYNKFLDIMKDFKSQAYVAPGSVSPLLFSVALIHPALLSVFPLFLEDMPL